MFETFLPSDKEAKEVWLVARFLEASKISTEGRPYPLDDSHGWPDVGVVIDGKEFGVQVTALDRGIERDLTATADKIRNRIRIGIESETSDPHPTYVYVFPPTLADEKYKPTTSELQEIITTTSESIDRE